MIEVKYGLRSGVSKWTKYGRRV